MNPSTSINNDVSEITADTGGASSSTNGAPMDERFIGRGHQINEPQSHSEVRLIDKRLLKAAIFGYLSELKHMVSNDPNVLLGITPQGSTCLHISLIFGHEEFSLTVLTQNESLLSRVNSYGETPLIVAVKSGHIFLVTTLLEKYKEQKLTKMILNSDINGDTALHHAIRHGHTGIALMLIEAEPNLSQRINKYNESPMYIAVMRGFDDVFKRLLETDNFSHKGAYDDNALHAAVRNKNLGIMRTIMESRPELARERNISGHMAIQYAVNRNQAVVIKIMLQHDLSLGYLVDSSHDENPFLISAASRGNVDVAREILKNCPDAPYCNGAEIVRALLHHPEIDVRIYDSEGKPAFWQLIEAKDSAKYLNWNEVFMLMSKSDPEATPFYISQLAMRRITVNAKQSISLRELTKTYTNNTSLVAILIATVTFAAAFTLPGGYSNDSGTEGLPVMARKVAFKAFLIFDTLAMCSSLAVAFMCLMARGEDLNFLLYYLSVTKKLTWFAYMSTTMAFATGLYTVVAPQYLWLAILICTLSIGFPFLTYLLGKWPLLKLNYRWDPAIKSNDLLDMV
ncbi:hypothetical protein LUZ61_011682 [Rhynchospora tenuis]|uniref:PGG domain-containing protein n=1 Tax=Rhynchospora tenuis TaxID=198213 RepID=A0AAD6A1J0_9POAL|nr:hypothetical protein LUZ61_011682 [Rhynchospora tenuis]